MSEITDAAKRPYTSLPDEFTTAGGEDRRNARLRHIIDSDLWKPRVLRPGRKEVFLSVS